MINDSALYQIVVGGILDDRWAEKFDGMTFEEKDGCTVLTGMVEDQAALHGILGRIRNLGLILISINRVKGEEDKRKKG